MYAILQQSGHQYRVSPGDRLLVDRLTAEVGSMVALEPVVLLAADDGAAQVGTPVVDGARVAAVVVSHRKGAKIRVFKYKPKKHYRRTHGHRSLLTELRVEALLAAGEPLPKIAAPEESAKPARSKKSAAADAPSATSTAKAGGRTRAAARKAGDATSAATAAGPADTVEAGPSPELSEPAAAQLDATEAAAAQLDASETAAGTPAPKRPSRPRAKKAAATDTDTDTSTSPSASGETEPEA